MKHVWSLICRKSIVDPDNNIISINEVLEELTINHPEIPEGKKIKISLEFELTGYWMEEKTDVETDNKALLEIFDPSNEKLGEFPFDLVFKGLKRLRTRLKFSEFVLTTSGEYNFKVKVLDKNKKYKLVAEIPLSITLIPIVK